MTHVRSIFRKQLKDTWREKTVCIQFVLCPVMAVIMTKGISIAELPADFFVTLFSAMYLGMAPLTAMSSVLSEEREKGTLRALLLSDMKPWEYLLGVGGAVWLLCMPGTVVLGITGGYQGLRLTVFLLVMAVGIFISMLLGAAIGIFSRNQMMAASVTVPVMMIFSFLPMLSRFNDRIAGIAKITYTGQISMLLSNPGSLEWDCVAVVLANSVAAVVCFWYAYKKYGLV